MLSLFIGIAVLAAVGGLFLADRSEAKEGPTWPSFGVAVLAGILAIFAIRQAQATDATPIIAPFAYGCLGVLLAGVAERFRKASPAVAIGLATAVVALISAATPTDGQAALAGAALTGIVLGSEGAMMAAFATGGLLAVNGLTIKVANSAAIPSDLGVTIGALWAVVALLPSVATKIKSIPSIAVSLVVPLCLGLGANFALKSAGSEDIAKYAVLPLVAGLVIHWLIADDDQPRSMSTNLIVGLIWLGAATLAFATGKSAGMAVWLVLAAGVPLALRNSQAAGSAAPFAALLWYRYIQSGDLSGGSDLSRFYVLTGIAAGIGLVAAGWEWRARVSGMPGAVGGALWSLLAGGFSLIAALVFGSRGFVGALEGSGLGSMLGGKYKRPITPVLLSAVMASAGALCLPALQRTAPYGRDEKMKLFVSAAAAILLVAGVLYALQIEKKREAV